MQKFCDKAEPQKFLPRTLSSLKVKTVTVKTPERRQVRIINNFENISHFFLVFPLLTSEQENVY